MLIIPYIYYSFFLFIPNPVPFKTLNYPEYMVAYHNEWILKDMLVHKITNLYATRHDHSAIIFKVAKSFKNAPNKVAYLNMLNPNYWYLVNAMYSKLQRKITSTVSSLLWRPSGASVI
mgnify:FL=1